MGRIQVDDLLGSELLQEAKGSDLQVIYPPDVLCTAAQRGTADNPDTLGEEGVGWDQEPGGGDPGQAGSDARLVTSHIFKAEELKLDKIKKASIFVCLLLVISTIEPISAPNLNCEMK